MDAVEFDAQLRRQALWLRWFLVLTALGGFVLIAAVADGLSSLQALDTVLVFIAGAVWAIAVTIGMPVRHKIFAGGLLLVGLCLVLLPEWNSRKPFLRDLYAIQPGMSEAEVRSHMSRWIVGTGWANAEPCAPDAGRWEGEWCSHGELLLAGALVFRHATSGGYDSDWGVVHFEQGRVVRVEIQPRLIDDEEAAVARSAP